LGVARQTTSRRWRFLRAIGGGLIMKSLDRPRNSVWLGAAAIAAAIIVLFAHILLARADVGSDSPYPRKPATADGQSTIAFDKSGPCAYFCGLHPFAKGKIFVSP
jgi:hypothetical protein